MRREGTDRLAAGLPRAVLLDPNDGCLTIARRLAARGVEVVALCPPTSSWVGRSNALRAVSVGPLPVRAEDSWLPALSALADRDGVLICGSDAASEFLCRHRPAVPGELRSFEGPATAHLRLMDKDDLYELATGVGVRVPASFRIDSPADLDLIERAELSAPCVAKPVMGHVGRRSGDFATRLLPDAAAVRAHLRAALDAGIPMLVSEHVPGPTTALEGAITLRAADGTWPVDAGRRKIRDYDHGVGSLVEAWDAVEARQLARRILEASDYVGLAATEFKRHAVTGQLYLIEINVRVPQYFGVYDAAGVDAAWRLYATLAELPVGEQPALREGVRVWMPQHDLHVVREMRRQQALGLREIVAPLAGVRDFGAWSWRDPKPALELARAELSRARRKRSRRAD
ncbi:hypothetical protein [Geodermatophilus sabuli]|uniref:hypothetical protein n=1 Tax=Geodermatophilus sabuli TaxID=1564158 RepID=UPI000BE24728|nr:hypothetical protein [Geodermatophilus sabuli]MBB3083601.1 putative ATP-grasp superfamily ATP-dependent carboligase [Geodermatophilus sabuli]